VHGEICRSMSGEYSLRIHLANKIDEAAEISMIGEGKGLVNPAPVPKAVVDRPAGEKDRAFVRDFLDDFCPFRIGWHHDDRSFQRRGAAQWRNPAEMKTELLLNPRQFRHRLMGTDDKAIIRQNSYRLL